MADRARSNEPQNEQQQEQSEQVSADVHAARSMHTDFEKLERLMLIERVHALQREREVEITNTDLMRLSVSSSSSATAAAPVERDKQPRASAAPQLPDAAARAVSKSSSGGSKAR